MIRNFSPYNIVRESLSELKDNERKVVAGRFGIGMSRKTLSSIGRELKLSRERIRQIEKESLKKIAAKILGCHSESISQILKDFSVSAGGISAQHKLAEKFLPEASRGDTNQFNSLNLIFCVIPEIKKIKKTKEIEEGWILASVSRAQIVKVIDEWVEHLKAKQSPEDLEVLLNAHPHHKKYEMTFLSELPSISKQIIKTEDGQIGLSMWSEINPRNVRDKIFYILNRAKKPLHFEEIAERIKTQGFDKKGVVKATVHNELIADDRFILVGRGIYALKSWGYYPGTVADMIRGVLKGEKAGMAIDEIIRQVLKQRVVKRNTVVINLKTRPEFKKMDENRYVLVN